MVALGAVVAIGGIKTLQNAASGESGRGYDMLDRDRLWDGPHELALFESSTLRAGNPRFRSALAAVAQAWSELPGAQVVDPRKRTNRRLLVSKDGHAALVVATIDQFPFPFDELNKAVADAAAANPQLLIRQTGDIEASDAVDSQNHSDLNRAELLSVPVTLLVLLLAFGALVAAAVPVIVALTAVIAAFGLIGPLSRLTPLDDSASIVVLLIGMAVGVDYSLFYVMRSREERRRGASPHEALETTTRTSGRTVIVSGSTVAVALAGMYVIRSKVFSGIATGTILVVACAVLASVLVLPAVLELLGTKIDRGRLRFLPHLRTERDAGGFWPAVVDRVLRRPLLALVLSASFLLALAAPAIDLRTAKPDDAVLSSQSRPALKTFAEIRRLFPGASEPARVVVEVPAGRADELARQLGRLRTAALRRGVAHEPVRMRIAPGGAAAAVDLPLTGTGDNATSRAAIGVIRRELVPATIGSIPGARTAVTGVVAEDVDFTHQMKHGLPYVVAFVLIFAFVLLLVAFRSIVVPLKAIALNLLSVGASYGFLVLVFEHHWTEPILGFESDGSIIAWLPIFLFVILFGLSMDYHVFILSRVRECVDRGLSTEEAVREGIATTAGIVTSAALVMVGVFLLLGTLSSLSLKEAGLGMAVAVLIDATIVRGVLLPASMALLGEWNWYLPSWMGWIPRRAIPSVQ